MTPSAIKTTFVETSRANAISCVTTIIVSPSPARERITSSTSPTICGSSALVGSSKSSTSGSIASARAIATRCFCPPESCAGRAWMYGVMPTRPRYSMAIFSASARLRRSTDI